MALSILGRTLYFGITRTDDNTDYKTENGYLERILQALQDFYIAVVVYEYLDKLIDFLR